MPQPRSHRPWWRPVLALAGLGAGGVTVVLAGSVIWVRALAAGHCHTPATVPVTPVALVLGAQVYPDGTPSPFLAGRLDLARQLYLAGRTRVIIVSGDNLAVEYNEPDAMRAYLIAAGVPAQHVVADYAGFDTYDSCVRARQVFGVDRLLVVTQRYHLPRAVATARAVGIDAVGVGHDPGGRRSRAWVRGWVRDQVACVKTVLDVATRRRPVLGPPESSVQDALLG